MLDLRTVEGDLKKLFPVDDKSGEIPVDAVRVGMMTVAMLVDRCPDIKDLVYEPFMAPSGRVVQVEVKYLEGHYE